MLPEVRQLSPPGALFTVAEPVDVALDETLPASVELPLFEEPPEVLPDALR